MPVCRKTLSLLELNMRAVLGICSHALWLTSSVACVFGLVSSPCSIIVKLKE